MSGHIVIDDKAILGGHVGTHQFIRIGKMSMVAGYTPVRKDVLPFCFAWWRSGFDTIVLNSIGLRRAGLKGDQYKQLEKVFRHLRDGGSIEDQGGTAEIDYLREFMLAPSKRGIYGFKK